MNVSSSIATAGRSTRTISAKVIKDCFLQAIEGHRVPLPDDTQCAEISEWLTEDVGRVGTEVTTPTLGVAEKHIRAVLRHLPAARASVLTRYNYSAELRQSAVIVSSQDPRQNPHLMALVEFEIAENALRALMDRYSGEASRSYTWHDLANSIAVCAERAWREAGRPARDTKPGSPICTFVHKVLEEAGFHKEEETVADVLRLGRRRPKQKVGKSRSR